MTLFDLQMTAQYLHRRALDEAGGVRLTDLTPVAHLDGCRRTRVAPCLERDCHVWWLIS